MNQPYSPILHLPVLLATDGSPTAVLAQQLIMPIVQHLALRSSAQTINPEAEAEPDFIAVHVQPKPSRFRRPGRQAQADELADESPIQSATIQSTTPPDLKSAPASSSPSTVAASPAPQPTTTLPTSVPDDTPSTAIPDDSPGETVPTTPDSAEPQSREESSETAVADAISGGTAPPIPDLPSALAVLQTELERSPRQQTIAASLVAVQGRPATEILKQASQAQAGLIALGCHGTGGAREMLVGSVSAEIARYADSHVLIARSAEPEHPVQPNWQHVLLVVSGESATQSAIALTRQLAPVGIQQVTVLCVQPPLTSHYLFGPFATPNPSWQLTQSLQAAQREQSDAILQQAQLALSDLELELEMLVQTGEPGPLICQIAEQRQANLIIIGSDASSKRSKSSPATPIGRRRLLRLTATADYVIHHANCPVLLSRMPN